MTDPGAAVFGDVEYVVFVPATRGLQPIFRTPAFALFDKPSGVLVHPQNRHTPYSMVDEIRHSFGAQANITHRIDQETSGLLLAGLNKQSERTIKLMFEHRKISKTYLAFVHGYLSNDITIDAPLIRRPDESALVRMVVKVHKDGKSSRTDVKVLKYYPDLDVTLIEAKPLTGRQHQIRVHMFHVKHPIVGDPIYGQSEADVVQFLDKNISKEERKLKSGASRLLLHAQRLSFVLSGIDYDLKSKADFIEDAMNIMR